MHSIKKIILLVTVISILLSSALVYARITHTLLVLDARNEEVLPNHFRTTNDVLPESTNVDKTGLNLIHAAGSQQFSIGTLKKALEHIPSQSVIVVDLRRESHGLLNGNAVSWYAPQNAANENKTVSQIKLSETRLLERLKKSHFRWVYQILGKTNDNYVEKTKRELVTVETVQSEARLLAKEHIEYHRFYIKDFHAPDDQSVVNFVNFAKAVPDTTWIYFHCRAGRGRTTTFMVLLDMMKNAKQVSFDDILHRQLALGGSNLGELPSRSKFKYKDAEYRLSFLKSFYQYARSNNDHYSTSYVSWKQNNGG